MGAGRSTCPASQCFQRTSSGPVYILRATLSAAKVLLQEMTDRQIAAQQANLQAPRAAHYLWHRVEPPEEPPPDWEVVAKASGDQSAQRQQRYFRTSWPASASG